MNNNEILKSLEEEKTKLESDFTIYTGQLKQLDENMASVEQEYKTKRESLEVTIERIRGAYKVVYDQLTKFGAIKEEEPKQEAVAEAPTQEAVAEEPKQEEKLKTTKTSAKKAEKKEEPKKDEKVGSSLTPEEIEKINKAVKKPEVKTVNGNEIPEYLQQEYNK